MLFRRETSTPRPHFRAEMKPFECEGSEEGKGRAGGLAGAKGRVPLPTGGAPFPSPPHTLRKAAATGILGRDPDQPLRQTSVPRPHLAPLLREPRREARRVKPVDRARGRTQRLAQRASRLAHTPLARPRPKGAAWPGAFLSRFWAVAVETERPQAPPGLAFGQCIKRVRPRRGEPPFLVAMAFFCQHKFLRNRYPRQ